MRACRLLKNHCACARGWAGANFLAWDGFILRNRPRRWVIFAAFLCYWTQLARRSQELGQTNVIVGGDAEDEHGADLVEATHLQLCEPADRLAPAEAFLDAFAPPLADSLAQARRDLARNGGLARLAVLADHPVDRHVRLDPPRLQALDEGLDRSSLSAEVSIIVHVVADAKRRYGRGWRRAPAGGGY